MKIEWHEIFTTGKIKEGMTDRDLCAIGLLGWANCHLSEMPDKFGHGMYEIGKRLGIKARQKNLLKYTDEILAKT